MKRLIIMRGLPGSGKSQLARSLSKAVYSTDDFFVGQDGIYRFDPSRIGEAHTWNQVRVLKTLARGEGTVVLDNTNCQRWEFSLYAEMGRCFGYEVEVRQPMTPWRNDPEECAKRTKHGVPLDIIKVMKDRWQD